MASILCECPSCRQNRDEFEYSPISVRPLSGIYLNKSVAVPLELTPEPANPFKQAVSDMFDSLAQAKPLPFQPEPLPEPVYTHVLLDFNSDGAAEPFMAELHTAESLLEAVEVRYDDGCRYQVYKLGALIIDVAGE